MPRTILEEAMADAKLLKETAIENAKNVLIEKLSPQIKEFIDAQLGENEVGLALEMPFQMPEGLQGMTSEDLMELVNQLREKEEKDKAAHACSPEHGDEGEEQHGDEEQDMAQLDKKLPESGMYEAEDKNEAADLEEAQEVVELTEEDLRKAFSKVVQGALAEASVSSGFGDAEDPTPKQAGGKEQTGILDKKAGESHWKDEEPPHAKDWTVKEAAYQKQIHTLKEEVTTLVNGIQELRKNLSEVNLFNSKLLYTNKLLNSTKLNLNKEQRIAVIEAFDRAGTLREVELVYKSLSESLKIAGVLGEGNLKRTAKGPKNSRPQGSALNADLLNESLERDAGGGESNRWQELAGLKKLVE